MTTNVVAEQVEQQGNHQLGNDEDATIILADASTIYLGDMSPRSYFAPSANCFENDRPIPCPDSTIVTKTDAKTGFTIIASKRKQNGELSSISVRDTINSGHRVPIQSGVSKKNRNDADPIAGANGEDHRSSSKLLTEAITSSVKVNVRRYLHKEQEMELQGVSGSPCTSYREIELAVVAESSFCQAVGGPTNVDMAVDVIVANVASEYEINSLCFTIVITHYEKHCDPSNDPYRKGVDLNVSGCSSKNNSNNNNNEEYGLLDHFEDFWNANRTNVHRDVAELFTGTPLECGPCNLGAIDPAPNSKRCCTVGCSRPKKSCSNLENSYGVSWVTYSSSHVARSNLVAHEIAHTLGKVSFHQCTRTCDTVAIALNY
jgi:Metallo-peptidase family M12